MKPTLSMLKNILAPAVLLAVAPAVYGQQLTSSPTSMQFLSGQSTTQNVIITAPGNAILSLTPSVTYTFPLNSTAQWVSVGAGNTGSVIPISINTSPGGSPLPNGNYHADIRFLASNGLQVTLPVDLTVTGSAGGGSTSLVSTNLISLSNTVLSTSFFINAQSTGQLYSITNPVSWLFVSPQSGFTTAGVATQIQVTVNTGFVFAASTATLTVNVGGQQQLVTVNYNPSGGGGTVGGVTLSTSQLNYALPVATSNSDTLVQSIPNAFTVTTSSTLAISLQSSTSVNTSLGFPWLATNPGVGGTTAVAGVPVGVGIFLDPRGLAAGSYQGTISVFSNFTLLGTVSVTLSIGTNVSPTSISVTTVGNTALDAQTRSVTVSANNQVVTMVPSTTTGGGWLSGGFSGTIASTQTVNFTINPAGLLPGTYNGTITVTIAGSPTASIPVTLNVGGGSGSGGVVSPSLLTLSAAAGSSTTGQITITSPVSTNFSIFPSGVTWLSFSPQTGFVTAGVPTTVLVTANAAAAGLAAGQTYPTTFQVSFGTGVAAQTVSVNFQVGSGGTGSGVVSPTSMTFSAAIGGAATSQLLTLTGFVGSFYSISSNSTWLTVSPSAGTMTSTQTQVSVIANPTGLGQSTYSGSLTANIGGVSYTIPVTFVVGLGGGTGSGVVSPTVFTFSVPLNGGGQSQQMVLNGTPGTLYSIISSASWLTTSLISGTLSSSQLPVLVQVNPATLLAGTYTGTLTVNVSGIQQIVSVTLNVGTGGTGGGLVSPASLTFSTPVGVTPATQSLSINSSTFATYTATSATSWLIVNPSSGQVNSGSSALVNVSVNVNGLAAGTYTGSVFVNITGQNSVTVPVTVNVGGTGGSGLTSPSQLSFTTPTSATAPPPQIVAINSPTGVGTQFGYSIDFPTVTWLTVSPLSGTAPTQVSVSVNPFGLTQGNYSTTLTVRYAGLATTASIPVTLGIGTTPGGSTGGQMLSHIADSAGWQTSITLVNLDSAAAQFSLRFYGSQTTGRAAGAALDMSFVGLAGRTSLVEGTIPAGGSRTITTAGTDAQLNMGWVELATTANLRGSAVFRDTVSRQEAAVTLTNPVRSYLLPFDNTSGRTTSFALVSTNPSTAISVTATVRDENGTTIGSTTLPLNARGHVATETTAQFPGTLGQRGVIEFSTANPDISGLGIRFDAPATSGPRPFTSFPVLPRP